MISKTISHYKIIEKLGQGGMGIIYKAQDLKLDRFVALKFLPPHLTTSDDEKQRFIHEAKAASSLDHNNICAIHEIDETEDGQLFISMAYYEGDTLDKKIKEKPLPLEEAIDITIQIAQGLTKAHETEIVHRDIKPANIMLTKEGVVKVLDFGLAKLSTQTKLTKESTTLGTVSYMSPEQAKGEEVDKRTDIWSLGAILYEIVTGQLPFKGDYDQAVVYSILNENPEPITALRTGVPMELERIVDKALSKIPAERYQNIGDLLVDLRSLVKKQESEVTKSKQSKAGILKPRSLIYGSVGVLVILICAVSFHIFSDSGETIDSIAVLPFSNTANDPELEYLSDGMTESIISSLSKLPSLNKVIARSSVFQYKGKEIVPKEIGKELGVKALLISQISQREDELSISVELVHAEKNSRLWGDQYKRSFSEIFKIQDDISKAIIENLRLELTGDEYHIMTKRYTENSEAYQLYLKGRYFANKHTEESLNKSIDFYQQAIDIDPQFALAYAALSFTYASLGWFNFIPRKTAYEKGMAAALKALEIDYTLGDAHAALASQKSWYGWEMDLKGAETAYEKALSLNPLDADVYHEYAHILIVMGKYDKGIRIMKKAVELEPISIALISCLGQSYFKVDQYDKAIDQLNKAIDMDPNYYLPYFWLGMTYLKKEKYDQAIEMFKKDPESSSYKTRVIGALGYTYAVQGMRKEALQQLDRLSILSKKMVVDPCYIAWIYTGLCEKDNAFEWLEKAYEERSNWLIMLNTDRLFDPLRSDTRFTDLLKKIGFDD